MIRILVFFGICLCVALFVIRFLRKKARRRVSFTSKRHSLAKDGEKSPAVSIVNHLRHFIDVEREWVALPDTELVSNHKRLQAHIENLQRVCNHIEDALKPGRHWIFFKMKDEESRLLLRRRLGELRSLLDGGFCDVDSWSEAEPIRDWLESMAWEIQLFIYLWESVNKPR